MLLPTFKGGIHPLYDGKALTMNTPIIDLSIKGEKVYPIQQHIGSPAIPIVKVGQSVLVGEKIANATSLISSNIISSISGKVKKIEKRRTTSGFMLDSIIIDNDEEYKAVEDFGVYRDYKTLSKKEIIEIIKEAGIVGLGGAGFPTHVKLSPKNPSQIEYILINGAECEPYLTSDYRIMLERNQDIINGIKIILYLFDNAKAIIAIEDNKKEAINILTKLCDKEEKIKVCPLKTKYPQGGEKSIVKAITLREFNHNELPMDVGCIIENISTVVAISDAVSYSRPLTKKVITITGDAFDKCANYRVDIGTSHLKIIEELGGFTKEAVKIISGGPMMGKALFDLDIPIIKTSSSILANTFDTLEKQNETPCIKCSKCLEVCPNRLMPVLMMDYAIRMDKKNFEKINGLECIECGSCSYICPAKRPLTQAFSMMRKIIFQEKKNNINKEVGA